MDELRNRYGHWEVSYYDKHDRPRYNWVWSDYVGYMRGLREVSPRKYGMMLIRIERKDFLTDRYWDIDGYRDAAIKEYRERINGIRLRYGLSQSEVQPYKRVS